MDRIHYNKKHTNNNFYRINIFCSVIISLLWFSLRTLCHFIGLFVQKWYDKNWKQIVMVNTMLNSIQLTTMKCWICCIFILPLWCFRSSNRPSTTFLYQFSFDYFEKCESWKLNFPQGNANTQTHIWWLRPRYSKHSICLGNKFICIYFQSQATVPFAHQTNRKTILSSLFGWIHFAEFVTMANFMTLMSSRTTVWIAVKMKSMKEKKDETFFRDLLEKLSTNNTNTSTYMYMAASEREKNESPINPAQFEFLILLQWLIIIIPGCTTTYTKLSHHVKRSWMRIEDRDEKKSKT